MIVSASYRTDIPAFFADWFVARLAAGSVRVANPYGGRDTSIDLRPGAVDGFIFWTRNLGPFAAALDAVSARATPFVVQQTITGLPTALERSVIPPERAVAQVRDVARRWGARAAVWRYDPVVVTSLTPPDWHRATFAGLAAALDGAVDEVVVSFVQPYRKTARNLDAAARRHRFTWRDPETGEKRALLAGLADIAAGHGMRLTLCTQPDLLGTPGAAPARCIDAARLSDVAGRMVGARTKGNRPGCLCAESRDIGAYDTCPHGCAYCYAVADHAKARRHMRGRDATADSLAASTTETR